MSVRHVLDVAIPAQTRHSHAFTARRQPPAHRRSNAAGESIVRSPGGRRFCAPAVQLTRSLTPGPRAIEQPLYGSGLRAVIRSAEVRLSQFRQILVRLDAAPQLAAAIEILRERLQFGPHRRAVQRRVAQVTPGQ